MSEPINDPPMVLRPSDDPGAEAPRSPQRPRPGFWEAVLWCLVFLAGQVFGAVVGTCVVFVAYALDSADPGQFMLDQLKAFADATAPKGEGAPTPIPFEFGTSLAWGLLTAQIFAFGLVAIVLPRRIGPGWKRQLGVRPPAKLHVLLVLLLVPGFMIGADAIQNAFAWVTGLKTQPMTGVLRGIFGSFPWPLTVLAIAIGPGVVEEFWCRGFLGRGLCARYGLVTGVLITSLLFACMHGDPTLLVVYTLMGAYLHFVYLATRNIFLPIILHACNNGFGVLLELTLNPEQLKAFPPTIIYICTGSLLVFGSVALWTGRAEVQQLSVKQREDNWQAEYPGISAPPPEANLRLGFAEVSPVAMIFTVLSFGALIYLSYRFLF